MTDPPEVLVQTLLRDIVRGIAQNRPVPVHAPAELPGSVLIEALAETRLLPLFADRFPSDAIPDSERQRVRKLLYRYTVRTQALTEMIQTVTHRMSQCGVTHAFVKGPVLAQRLYSDALLRPCDDIDLLVPLEHVATCVKTLRADGWQPHIPMDSRLQQRFARTGWDITLRSPHTGLNLDINAHCAPRHFCIDWTLLNPDTTLPTVDMDHCAVPALPPPAEALFLAIHGYRHGWSRLDWILDFGLSAHRLQASSQALHDLRQLAQHTRCRKILATAAVLAHATLDINMDGVLNTTGYTPETLNAVNTVSLQTWSGLVCQREGLGDRMAMRLARTVLPSYGDWSACPLPVALSPLYAFIRPVRVLFNRICTRRRPRE